MSTHPAVIANGIKQPLTIGSVRTPVIQPGEVRVRVEWVPSAPLDVYQIDAGLMAQFPQSFGDSAAGTVVAAADDVKRLKVGDKVFGFFFHNEKERAQQVYVTALEHLFAKVPEGISLPAAATVPNNFCTAFFTLSEKLGIELPWPRPELFAARTQNAPILIWGAATSVGQYAVQILKYWGYKNIIATASARHHDKLRGYGAKHVFDYRDPTVVQSIREVLDSSEYPDGVRVFDCVDSKFGSLLPISNIATQPGSIVAALLPVVVSSPSGDTPGATLELAIDPSEHAAWASEVKVYSVAAYAYESNTFLRDHLQPEIMPSLLAEGAVEPNKQHVIEGKTLLERARTALDIMRANTVSGERLVWKVWTEEEFPGF